MSDLKEYKCPACGGAMEFDSKTQKMKCPYCDTEMEMAEFEEANKETEKPAAEKIDGKTTDKKIDKELNKPFVKSQDKQWEEGETDNIKVYTCESCGGEIIAEDTTGSGICPFCGNKVLIKSQFKGDLKPDYVIPFKLDKKDAKQAYFEHLKDKPFLPPIFKAQNHIDEIRGVYVPFWLYDVDTNAEISYEAEKIRVWTSGNVEYTEHRIYEARREGTIGFNHIPEDGSEKMDDTLMESVEPFDFKEAVPFNSGYLAGYMADRYDVPAEERMDRVKERIKRSAEDEFKKTVQGYNVVTEKFSNVNIKDGKYWYALYPVWILNTTWKGKKYVFAMNGQTGKLVGDLPVDKGLFWKYIGIRTPIIAVIIYFLLSFIDFV